MCRRSTASGWSRRRAPAEAQIERVYGPDLMLAAFARSESAGWRHFLYDLRVPGEATARLRRGP